MANGRESEAFDFFVEYHGNGDREDELVRFEFEEVKAALALEKEAKSAKWRNIVRDKSSLHRLALAALMTFMTSMSGSSIIYYYYTVVLELVGITDTTVQTGIGAGLSMWTWFIQIAAVFVGKRVGKKTILLWIWPCLLVSLAGLCATRCVRGLSMRRGAAADAVSHWSPLTAAYLLTLQAATLRPASERASHLPHRQTSILIPNTSIPPAVLHSSGFTSASSTLPVRRNS